MVAGYFAQRASKENQTTVLRVLKEIGTDAVLENATLGKAVKAKYGLPHKGCGKVSKFLMWAGVPKKVVDSFYYVIKDLNNDPSQVQAIRRSLGGEVLGYQDTLDEDDGSVYVDDLVELTKAEISDVVSKFQKEAYLRKRDYFINYTPKKGGMSYIYELFPKSGESLDLIEKENEQVFIHLRHFSTKTGGCYSRWNHVYQMQQLRQSALYKSLRFTNVFERTCFDIFSHFDGSSAELRQAYNFLMYEPKGTFLMLLGLEQFIKSHKSLRRLFKWLPSFISALACEVEVHRPSLKQTLEETSMLPLPTSIRLYLNALALATKTSSEDPYRWVDTIIKELPEYYQYDAFLAQDKQSGFLVVYENDSHELEKAVLVSSFFQNDKQKEALQDTLSVFELYEDFASLFNEELSGSTVQYFNWRTQ